jgi:hypothetical protein
MCCEAVVSAELLRSYDTDGTDKEFEKARRDELDEIDRLPDRVVEAHSRTLFAYAQAELVRLGGIGTYLPERARDYANRLGTMLYQASEAVRIVSNRKRAKEVQAEAAPAGIPLAICRGRTLRKIPEVRYGVPGWREKYGEDDIVVSSRGDGCLKIIEDSLASKKPRIYCDQCNKRGPGLKANALAKVKEAWKGNVKTNQEQRSVLCKCGRRFTTDRRKVQRCPHCEGRHI